MGLVRRPEGQAARPVPNLGRVRRPGQGVPQRQVQRLQHARGGRELCPRREHWRDRRGRNEGDGRVELGAAHEC